MRWRIAAAAVGVPLVVAAVVLRMVFVDTANVLSDSMSPTLCTGDTVVLARLHNGDRVQRNDIVTFPSPRDGEQTIKRVVATQGETVVIKDALLYVDGLVVDEPYVDHASIDGVYTETVTVPEGTVYVMGDDREVSIDSRVFGPVPTAVIDGRFLFRLWSDC